MQANIEPLYGFFAPTASVKLYCKLSKSKVSYLISHGLGPFFTKRVINDIKTSSGIYCTLHFNETTTAQVRKQMDLLVRFHCERTGQVEARFIRSMCFGHAFGDNVASTIEKVPGELQLPLSNLLSISTDGPNVNKRVKPLLNETVQSSRQEEIGLIDVGFCSIHVVANAFKKALVNFGKPLEDIVLDLFYFFRLSSSRREYFEKKIQEDLGLNESLHFVRHVQTRWFTLIDALERIAARYEASKRFVIHFIPRQITIRTFCRQTDTSELLQLSKTNRPLSNSISCSVSSQYLTVVSECFKQKLR